MSHFYTGASRKSLTLSKAHGFGVSENTVLRIFRLGNMKMMKSII